MSNTLVNLRTALSIAAILFLVAIKSSYSLTDEKGWSRISANQTQSGFTYLSDGSLLLDNVLLDKTGLIADQPDDVVLLSPASPNGTFIFALPVEADKGAFTGYIVNLKTKSILKKIDLFELRPLWRWVAWSSDERYIVFGGSEVQTLAFVQLATGYLRTIPISLEKTYGNNLKEIQSFTLDNFQWLNTSTFSVPVRLYCNFYDDQNCTGGMTEGNVREVYNVQVNLENVTVSTQKVELTSEMIRKQIEDMISEIRSSIEDLKRQNLNPSGIEKSLAGATDALNNQKFEIAQSALKLAKSSISIIWNTYSQIQSAKVEINVAKEIGCDTLPATQKIKSADDALAEGDYSSAVQLAVEATQLARTSNCGKVVIQDLRAMATKYDQRTITISGEVKSIDPILGQGYRIILDDGSGTATVMYSESLKNIDVGDQVDVEGTYDMNQDLVYATKVEPGPFFTLGRILLILLIFGAALTSFYYRSVLTERTRKLAQLFAGSMQKAKTRMPAKVERTEAVVPTSPYLIFTSPAGALIAAICFFLPWVKFECGGMRDTQSGSELGGLLWVVFISALGILVAFLYYREQKQLETAKKIILISSIIGIGIIIIRYLMFLGGEETPYGRIRPKDIGYSIQFGAIGTLIGLVASLFGIRYLKTDQEEAGPPAKIQPEVFDPSRLTKKCPACKEEIKLEAKVCRFCHSQFSDDEVNQAIAHAKQQYEAVTNQ